MARQYRIVHEPMLLEYLNKTYPPGSWRTNVRLGRPSPELEALATTPAERRMLAITTFQADAVVVLPDRVDIVEAIVRPEWWKVSQLKIYGHMFGTTEEYREHWGKPRRLLIVAAVTNEFCEWWARTEGVAWVTYRPIWLDEYAAGTAARAMAPPTIALPEEEERP